jgi:hypothetical protein
MYVDFHTGDFGGMLTLQSGAIVYQADRAGNQIRELGFFPSEDLATIFLNALLEHGHRYPPDTP